MEKSADTPFVGQVILNVLSSEDCQSFTNYYGTSFFEDCEKKLFVHRTFEEYSEQVRGLVERANLSDLTIGNLKLQLQSNKDNEYGMALAAELTRRARDYEKSRLVPPSESPRMTFLRSSCAFSNILRIFTFLPVSFFF